LPEFNDRSHTCRSARNKLRLSLSELEGSDRLGEFHQALADLPFEFVLKRI
jgi:hypothetical protein